MDFDMAVYGLTERMLAALRDNHDATRAGKIGLFFLPRLWVYDECNGFANLEVGCRTRG